MSSSTHTTKVLILDKEYLIACPPEEQQALQLSAQHLDKQMRAIRSSGKVHGLERIAVMAALNITHEFIKKDQAHSSSQNTALRLATKIDDFLQEIS
ncbi:MAG: cell division protein ZapA [Pseudomonadales bacterium]|nr:cell division protein ZapA [Pseudomonadales bacterium]